MAAAPLTRIRELGAWLGRVGNVVMPSDVGKWGCRRLPSPTSEGHRVDAICLRVVSGCLPPSWVPSSGSGRGDRSAVDRSCGNGRGDRGRSGVGHRAGPGQCGRLGQGTPPGGLLLSMAPSQLAGADFLVGMDRHRADVASQLLEPVPTPASTTTAQTGEAFHPNAYGRDRERDRDGQRAGAEVVTATATDPVVDVGDDRRGHRRCGGLRTEEA